MIPERPQGKPEYWPFIEPFNENEVVKYARKIHSPNQSLEESVAKALFFTASYAIASADIQTYHDREDRIAAVAAYTHILYPIAFAKSGLLDLKPPLSTDQKILKAEIIKAVKRLEEYEAQEPYTPLCCGFQLAKDHFQKIIALISRRN